MHRNLGIGLVLIMSLAPSLSAANEGARQGYAVAERYPLHQNANGVEGTLQLLLDERLSEPARKELWARGEWSLVLQPDSKLYKEFSSVPPAHARLTIVDSKGRLLADRDLGTPLARLDAWNSSNELFLLTEDHSAGFGSYNGPGSIVLRVAQGAVQDVKALNNESHQEKLIRLVKSLKADWRREGATEILSVSCHEKGDGGFVIEYVRYSFDGTRWLEYERESPGFWESDEPFPPRSAFP